MKITILSYGCSNNLHESEIMAGLLESAGHTITKKKAEAEAVIVNMCTVKTPTENKIVKTIRGLAKEKKILVIAGCIPKHLLQDFQKIAPKASIITTHNIPDIADILSAAQKGKRKELTDKTDSLKICLPKKRTNKIINIIPICSGCIGSCSYCSVKAIKGKLFSYPKELIIKEAEKSLKQGCKEIWITSQDNAAYGIDKGKPELVELLKGILSLPYEFKLRLGMMNPNNVAKIEKGLIEIYKHKKMFKFLHIPVQAGSDRILKLMNRNYKAKDFLQLVSKFKKAIPGLTISTDIICGFPGETEQEFNETLELVKELKPTVLNISRYWARPGTEALNLPGQLHGSITKERSQKLTELFKSISLQENRKWIGWKGNVLVDEQGKNKTSIARNDSYKQIVIKGSHALGDIIEVKIKSATAHDLRC